MYGLSTWSSPECALYHRGKWRRANTKQIKPAQNVHFSPRNPGGTATDFEHARKEKRETTWKRKKHFSIKENKRKIKEGKMKREKQRKKRKSMERNWKSKRKCKKWKNRREKKKGPMGVLTSPLPPRRPKKNDFLHKNFTRKSWGKRGKKKDFEHPRKKKNKKKGKNMKKTMTENDRKWKKIERTWQNMTEKNQNERECATFFEEYWNAAKKGTPEWTLSTEKSGKCRKRQKWTTGKLGSRPRMCGFLGARVPFQNVNYHLGN